MSAAGRVPSTLRSSPFRHRRARSVALVIVAVLIVAVGGVACGDGDTGPGRANAEFADYCEATFKLETYFNRDPDVDVETASQAEIDKATTAYLRGAKSLVDAVVPIAPEEVRDPIDVQVRAFTQALGGADPGIVFETPEVDAASEERHAFDRRNCGWGRVAVTAREYTFGGLPNEVKAGRTSIDLDNQGKELHEIVLLSKNPGVTESFDQLLALPGDEALARVTPAARAVAAPGDTDHTVVDLAPGTYLAVCFIPQGVVSDDSTPAADAKPHFRLGMRQEVTVA